MKIKELLSKLYHECIYFIKCIKWYCFYKKLQAVSRKANYINENKWFKSARILLVVPHADDELLSSYTLLRNAPNLTVYYCGFVGTNPNESNIVRRKKEIEDLCKKLSVPIIHGNGDCMNFETTIINGEYDILVIPLIVDWHFEHRKISYMLSDVLTNNKISPQIYCYSVTVPNESDDIINVIELTQEEQKQKYALFKEVYISQKFMPLYRFKINEWIYGLQAGIYAAETFQPYTLNQWLEQINIVKKAEKRGDGKIVQIISLLKRNLSDMKTIRKLSKDFHISLNEELKDGPSK